MGSKKEKGGFFLVRGRGRELGGRYPLAGLCPAFMCFKKKKKKIKNKKEEAKTQTHKPQYPNGRVVLDKPPYIAKPNIIANQHIHSLTSILVSPIEVHTA